MLAEAERLFRDARRIAESKGAEPEVSGDQKPEGFKPYVA